MSPEDFDRKVAEMACLLVMLPQRRAVIQIGQREPVVFTVAEVVTPTLI